MPILKSNPPALCVSAFNAALPGFLAGAGGLTGQAFAGAAPTIPTAAEIGSGFLASQQVFVLSLNDVINNPAPTPVAAGWRFFAGDLHAPSNQTIIGRVVQIPPSQTWKLVAVYYGEKARYEFMASDQLSTLDVAQELAYDARLLEVPGVNVRAFWLAGQSEGAIDYFVPYPAQTAQLVPALRGTAPYSMASFLAAIRPLATQNLALAAGQGA